METLLVQRRNRGELGYAMVGLLVVLGVMGIVASMTLPVWSQAATREREAELIFRGEQYARAVELYQRQHVGAYAPDFETLVERRFLRRLYGDPMSDDGEFQVIHFDQVNSAQGDAIRSSQVGESGSDNGDVQRETELFQLDQDREQGGVVGVVSRSNRKSLRVYNQRENYNQWAFVYVTSVSGSSVVTADNNLQRPSSDTSGLFPAEDRGRLLP